MKKHYEPLLEAQKQKIYELRLPWKTVSGRVQQAAISNEELHNLGLIPDNITVHNAILTSTWRLWKSGTRHETIVLEYEI